METRMSFLPDRSEAVTRHILERNAEEIPNRDCVLFENGETWNYGDALRQAYRAASVLSDLGINRCENVLIFLPNGQGWLRAWWGVAILGGTIVPVNTAYKGEMLRHICQDSLSTHIITTPDLAERTKSVGLDLNVIDQDILPEGRCEAPKQDAPIEPWDIHAIMYTSGTTGPSKGVIIPYLNMHMSGPRTAKLVTYDDTFLIYHPLFHISGMFMVHAAMTAGARIALQTVFSGSRFWDMVRGCEATVALMTGNMPEVLTTKSSQPGDSDNPLRKVWCSPMVDDPDNFKTRFGIERVIGGYGMTETCNIFFWTEGNPPKGCGKPREGIEVRLVDDHDIPVAMGEVGELIVRTDLPWELGAGYWRRPEATAQACRNGWFHSGDMFLCDEDGNYFFVDRKKDAIRRRGENISSMEVEREVLAYPDVLEAACVAVPTKFGEEEVKVFVVPRNEEKFDPVDLIKFLVPRMPYFMVPRYVEVIDEFPKTITDRIKKNELRDRGNSNMTWDRQAADILVQK
jgi:carnitine-CoA ligase